MKKKLTGILMSPEEITGIDHNDDDDDKLEFQIKHRYRNTVQILTEKSKWVGERTELEQHHEFIDFFCISECLVVYPKGNLVAYPKSWFKEIREEYDYQEFAKNIQFVKAWNNDTLGFVYGYYLGFDEGKQLHKVNIWCHDIDTYDYRYFIYVKPMKEPEEIE